MLGSTAGVGFGPPGTIDEGIYIPEPHVALTPGLFLISIHTLLLSRQGYIDIEQDGWTGLLADFGG